MLSIIDSFSGFSVKDKARAKEFYSKTLGLSVKEDAMGLTLQLAGGNNVFVYPKADHAPATFTVLNFVVKNIDETIDGLVKSGVQIEHYEGMPAAQDEKGILRGLAANQGPDIAWFKDPDGNILSILQQS